ncbi:hypothetical protein T439DRAFT_328733 [Meredithblackwellia eburnea MCA 4105]
MDANISQMVEMGLNREQATKALKKTNNDLARAVELIFSGESIEPSIDDMPPLIAVNDEPPPYGPATGPGGTVWGDFGMEYNNGPGAPSNSVIDLTLPSATSTRSPSPINIINSKDTNSKDVFRDNTNLNTTTTSHNNSRTYINLVSDDEDDELAKAKALSLSTSGAAGANNGQGKGKVTSASDEDEDMIKAMEMSVMSVGSQGPSGAGEEGKNKGPVELEEGTEVDRVRPGLDRPLILRSSSAYLSTLSSYLVCLYALPSFRKAILNFRPSEDEYAEREFDLQNEAKRRRKKRRNKKIFEGYWKGEVRKDVPVAGAKEVREAENSFRLIHALQRLFTLMAISRRKFVYTAEFQKVAGIVEGAFKFSNGAEALRTLHREICEAFVNAKREVYGNAVGLEMMTEEEANENMKKDARTFAAIGRQVQVEYMSILPPLSEEEQLVNSTNSFEIPIFTSSSPPDTLYSALDRHLRTGSTLSLLTSLPDVLLFEFTVIPPRGKDGMEDYVSSRNPLDLPVEMWLDRYWIGKRKEIAEGWARIDELKLEIEATREMRRQLATTKEDKSAVELFKTAIQYFEKAETASVDVGEVRRTRQQKLLEAYRKALKKLEDQLDIYDNEIARLELEEKSIFEEDPQMKSQGPYHLCAVVVRNGLNGRGSAWSYVRGDDGRWWKTVDLEQIEVNLEQVLGDRSGLFMGGGVAQAFYQLDAGHQELKVKDEPEIPPYLRSMALYDNVDFGAKLPHNFTDGWEHPPHMSDNSSESSSDSSDSEVEYPTVHQPSSQPTQDITPPASPHRHQEPEMEMKEVVPGASGAAISPLTTPRPLPVTPAMVDSDEDVATDLMSVDDLPEIPAEGQEEGEHTAPSMVLRGGAGIVEDEQEEDDDDYDDEEIDEDEVELGCLKPMPETGDWDIDVAVGKAGGVPIWLDPRSPLNHGQVRCGICGGNMVLLLQLNSPDDSRPHAAARTLYVFACRGKDCRAQEEGRKSTIVWRTQMPSPNAFYPHTEKTASQRKQLEDALTPSHGLGGERPEGSKTFAPLPEWEIECDSEPYEESYLSDTRKPLTEEDDGNDQTDAIEPDTATGVDKAFLVFQDRIERVPEQVLRFYRLPDVEDPEPLWVSSKKLDENQIPPCSICGGVRKIEFQILSTLLSYFKDDYLQFDSLLVYSCVDNCPIPEVDGKTGWAEEFVTELVFAADGVKFGGGIPSTTASS